MQMICLLHTADPNVHQLQLAAVEAWTEVRKMRTTSGKVPSRDDLAGYFARAHKSTSAPVMPDSPAAVTDRTPHPMDYTVKFGATPSQLAATVHKVIFQQALPIWAVVLEISLSSPCRPCADCGCLCVLTVCS